ncbi:UNVERIFIED_CONTAM: hypothetical protein RMT77_011338 [Armadillidium vulgare]
MTENINSLSYDLAQNYIFGLELASLEYFSAFSLVTFIFKSEKIINEIRSLEYRCITDFKEEWIVIVKNVEKMALECIIMKSLSNLIKVVVSFTAEEIRHFISKNTFFDRRLFLKNFVYTSQGTINTYKTVLEILKKDELTNEVKFEIACHYFLGKSIIKNYYENLPHSSREEYLYSVDVCPLRMRIPIFYWYYRLNIINMIDLRRSLNNYFKELEPILKNFNEDASPFKILLMWTIVYSNDVAVSYLCRKISEIIPQTFIKEFLNRHCLGRPRQCSSNIYMYLYFDNRSRNFTLDLDENHNMLQMITSHRWICILFKILDDFHEHLTNLDYFILLAIIVEVLCWNLRMNLFSKSYREILKTYINIMPSTTKDYIMNDEREYIDLLEFLLYERDKEIIQIILSIGISETFFDEVNFSPILEELDFTLIDQCMEGISSKNVAINLKLKLFLKHVKEVWGKLKYDTYLNSLRSLLNWGSLFCSMQDIIDLKASLPFLSDGKIIKDMLFKSQMSIKGCKFKFVDNVLFWCLETKTLFQYTKREPY